MKETRFEPSRVTDADDNNTDIGGM